MLLTIHIPLDEIPKVLAEWARERQLLISHAEIQYLGGDKTMPIGIDLCCDSDMDPISESEVSK